MSSKEQSIWTEAELETARTIVKRCGIRDGLFKGPRTLNAVESIAYALATTRREARAEAQQQVFAEAIRQGVNAVQAATIASAALDRAAKGENENAKR